MSRHHDEDARGRDPANRLGIDYRAVPARAIDARIIDVHTHVRNQPGVEAFFEAAELYGIARVVSMTPLDEVDALQAVYGERLEFIAIPRWRSMAKTDEFRRQWIADLAAFRGRGARRMKFWMAPPMRGEHGLTLRDPFFIPVIDAALELGYAFMIHVGDPSVWFRPGGRYADAARYGTKQEQYEQLEYLLERVAPRSVIAAHLGGNIEEPDFLQRLLNRYPNLYFDSSATKWVVREIAWQPERVRAFMIHNADRILFGSDLVVDAKFDFTHYASRYWVHQQLWETDYRGESPIADPDAPQPPRLAGLALPPDVLHRLYHANAERLGHG